MPIYSDAADLERVSRRFYQRFKAEHAALMSAIRGLPDDGACSWYALLLLSRLMFRRFLQQKALRADAIAHLLPPLQIEKDYPAIEIPDEALQRVAAFLDGYRWCLDGRPPRDDREITPDALSALFEQYINQKQMGAYYTREDITSYISRNTIIPALLDAAQARCAAAFRPNGVVWRLLRDNADRYIFGPMLTGMDVPLPPEIAAGIGDVERREGWNRQADSACALPGETWREAIARRERCQNARARLAAGAITSIHDLITWNLDIQQFALDTIAYCEQPELLRAFWQALEQISVLDPTCGSGAFLFAALNVLAPLYDVCLERMQAFLEGGGVPPVSQPAGAGPVASASQPAGAGPSLADFRAVLARVARYPNRRCFILTSIIAHNLYGVDIMPEAVEITRLRLFLKLVAQVEDVRDLEPLPDTQFNIRVGNTLVGYAAADEAQRGVSTADELDRSLAREYGIEPGHNNAFTRWRVSHQPFHWCVEFPEIVHERGGFDVILGNPPYVEYYAGVFPYTLPPYRTLPCANLYPCIVERSHALLHKRGYVGMILPLAAFATRNMIPLIEGVLEWFPATWLSFYHFRPAMLFSGGKVASIPTAILLASARGPTRRFSTGALKWSTPRRGQLFPTLAYQEITAPPDAANRHYYPKFGAAIENSIMQKVLPHQPISSYLASADNGNNMYYRSAGGLYWKVFVNFAWPYQTTSNKRCAFDSAYDRDVFVALCNSSLFWWYYTVTFDTFNLKDYLLFGFRFSYPPDAALVARLKACALRLMDDYRAHAAHLKRGATGSYTIYARKSKAILDEIDGLLAQHYGLTAEERDFILNYDLKYRMGQEEDD